MSRGKEKFVMRLAFGRGQDFDDRSQTLSEPKSLPNRIYRPLTWLPRSAQSKVGNTKARKFVNVSVVSRYWCEFHTCHNDI